MSAPTIRVSVSRADEKPYPEEPPALSDKEKEAANAPSAAWPYPKERDGWCRIHVALSKGLGNFVKAVSACKDRSSETLEPWVVKTLSDYYGFYNQSLHHHHDSEEEIAFPFMLTKVKDLPPRLASDHNEIMEHTDSIKTDLAKLAACGEKEHRALLEGILEKATKLQAINEEHFKEEEEEVMPLLRHYFTEKEFAPCLKQILAKQTPVDLGFLLDGFEGGKEEQVSLCKEIAKIPGPVISLVIMPGLSKYRRMYVDPLEDVIAGEQRPKSGSICCFGC